MDRKKLIRIAFAVLGGLTVGAIAAFSAYMLWERAPEVKTAPETLTERIEQAPAAVSTAKETPLNGEAFNTRRRDGVYTMLLVGNDDGNGNTDTIMVGKLDTVRHRLDFVSIPRDTLINVDWRVRKLNSVYWGAANSGESGIDALLGHVKKLVGFDIDCYAVLDLEAFVEAVDAMGGVYFDVPEPIFYEDYWQGLYLDIDAGYQLLDGYQSMCLCRYRSGYITGDIGRIEMQHKFLKAAAEQYIKLGKIPNVSQAIDILAGSMDTNLSAANIAYFVRQALMCPSENVNFYTAPNTPAFVQSYSYAFLDLYDWLAMVNERLNPYESPVSEGDLDLVYMMGGNVHCTGVLKGTGYFDLGRSQRQEPAPEEAEEAEAEGEALEEESSTELWFTPAEPDPEPEETEPPFLDFPQAGSEAPESQKPGEGPEIMSPTDDDWLSVK